MKLFAFQPNGHGEYSFFIMAENIEIAQNKVDLLCTQEREKRNGYGYEYAYYKGNNYYTIREYDENEIAINDND